MKTLFRLLVGFASCPLLTSCIATSENPLSSPDTAVPDPKLVGTWHEKGDNDETLEFTVKNAHWMHLEDRKTNKPPESYDMFVTVIDGHRFLNVRPLGNEDQGLPPNKEYYIIRYEVTDHVFSTWWLDQDKAAEVVRSGKLKGTIRQNKNPSMIGKPPHPDVDVVLQDSGANMVKFIRHAGFKSLFSDDASKMIRVETVKQ